ncbi:hypothetical protein GCM10027610_071050 [Dactylosporangium cerinum]
MVDHGPDVTGEVFFWDHVHTRDQLAQSWPNLTSEVDDLVRFGHRWPNGRHRGPRPAAGKHRSLKAGELTDAAHAELRCRRIRWRWVWNDSCSNELRVISDSAALGCRKQLPDVSVEGRSMARRVIQELIDDIDGKPADESVTFSLDGMQYEIDLSGKNADALRAALAPYLAAGTKVGRGGIVPGGSRGRSAQPAATGRGSRDQNRAIREWAEQQGIEVSERGRIKQDIIDRYQAAGGR